jgi:hypothetical protein
MAQILIDALNATPPPAEFTTNAKRMRDLFALHEFQAVVEVFGNALEAEINRELDDSNPLIQEIAADFRELIRIDEDVLDLTLRYGRERTAPLRDLQRQVHRP